MNLFEVAREIASRLVSIFLRGADGRRPVYGGSETFQTDPHWRDHILFYEYFHGDNGAGIGASHQTGWTGLVATLIDLFGQLDAKRFLEMGKTAAFEGIADEAPGASAPSSREESGVTAAASAPARPSARRPATPGRPTAAPRRR